MKLSVGIIRSDDMMQFWADTGHGLLVPKLRTLHWESLFAITGRQPSAAHFLHAMMSRAKSVGIERLQRLVVSRGFVREQDEQQLRTCVDELMLLDST